jgi:phospholipid/cholesterol/gamma-HCH transport system permease protein
MAEPDAQDITPQLLIQTEDHSTVIRLSGDWTLRQLQANPGLGKQLKQLPKTAKNAHWDTSAIQVLDSFAALLIWQAWQEQFPANLTSTTEQTKLFTRWQQQVIPAPEIPPPFFKHLRTESKRFYTACRLEATVLLVLLGQLLIDIAYLSSHPRSIPWAEISDTIYDAGVKALGITALVGFLIGIVLSYLSALQLKMFGAEIYIINILGMSVIRELGPLLAAILVAGRSGSSMTAQIGIMRVTEELDALSALGISHSLRLVLPKVAALILVMPLLSIWTNAAAMFGGILSAQSILDISYRQFLLKLPDTVPLANLFISLGKSAVFGLLIALLACHFGFKIKPNTESLGNETTNSVVAAITVVIMVDALFAILFMNVGMP